jgi:tetratricopeptide (TPR) repeat protein
MAASEVQLDHAGGRSETLTLVGPSFWGSIYRSEASSAFCRLLPIERVPLAARQSIRRWTGQQDRAPRPRLARIVEARQLATGGAYLLRYGVDGSRTLLDVAAEPDPEARLICALRLLEAFPGWAEALGPGWLPMPSDIVLNADGTPCLLPMPNRWVPDVTFVLAEPARAWYLAPEFVRGRSGPAEATDRYALGMVLFSCLSALRSEKPAELLLQVATGTARSEGNTPGSLPLWLERLDATRKLHDAIAELLVDDPAARCRCDLEELRDRLSALLPWTEPKRAIVRLLEGGRLPEAMVVLQDALLESEPYDLLLLGGGLSAQLGRPLQAVDLLERAITGEPGRTEAYEEQLRILLGEGRPEALGWGARAQDRSDRLVHLVERDFERLPADVQATVEQGVADYLLSWGRCKQACAFIHPRLFEKGKWLWWKFGMNTSYAQALAGDERKREAKELIGQIESGFERALRSGAMTKLQVRPHQRRLAALKAALLDADRGAP